MVHVLNKCQPCSEKGYTKFEPKTSLCIRADVKLVLSTSIGSRDMEVGRRRIHSAQE